MGGGGTEPNVVSRRKAPSNAGFPALCNAAFGSLKEYLRTLPSFP